MGAKNSSTYNINIKAHYESLQGLVKELEKVEKNNSGLVADDNSINNVIVLRKEVESLLKIIDSNKTEDFGFNPKTFIKLNKDIDAVISRAEKLYKTLKRNDKINLSSAEELKELEEKRSKANKLGNVRSQLSRKFNRDSKQTVKEVTAGLSDSQGQPFEKVTEFSKYVKEVESSNTATEEHKRKVLEIWEILKKKLGPAMDEYERAWNEAGIATDRANKEAQEYADQLGRKYPDDTLFSAITNLQGASYKGTSDLENTRKEQNKQSFSTQGVANYTKELNKLNNSQKNYNTTLGKAVYNVLSYGSALTLVRTLSRRLIQTITEMDKALTDMTVVTQLTREQAWNLTGQLQELANATGMTTTEVAQMTTMYLQQGQTLSNALELTEAAAKAARIAGISGSESINLLTNAMNGFQMSASQAMEVSDKFAALAAAAATDYEELATALSKVAAQANLAGMSMDFTLGLLTKGIEVTREAPETIGTALKTVISRMRELTDYGETLEDGVDVNRVDTALKNIGVSLLDTNREFRDLELVLTEVGEKWDTLNKNQQANVAVALAGTRQQSRLIAMMQDFDRTQELVNISMSSAGATAAQHRKYMQGLEAATTALTTSYQKLITSFTNSDIAIGAINGLSSALNFLGENIGIVYGALGVTLALYAPLIAMKVKDHAMTLMASAAQLIFNKQIKDAQKENAKLQVVESTNITTRQYDTFVTWSQIKATKGLTEERRKELLAIRLAKLGIKGETAEKVINTIITAGNEKAQEELNKELNKSWKGRLTKAFATLFDSEVTRENTDITLKNVVARKALNAATTAAPYIAVAAVIIALVAAWWALNKETEEGIRLQESLKGLFESLFKAITQIFEALQPLLELVLFLFDLIMTNVAGGITNAINIIRMAIDIINLILTPIKAIMQAIGSLFGDGSRDYKNSFFFKLITGGFQAEALEKISNWLSDITEKWSELLETPAEKSERLADQIAKSQEKIYDAQQKSATLSPLLDEYEALNKKVVKTAEDFERIKEIEQEIGDLDESYKDKKGNILWDIVVGERDAADTEVAEEIQKSYQAALEGIKTGIIKEEFRAGISTFYTEEAKKLTDYSTAQLKELGYAAEEVSTITASNISKNYEKILSAISDESLAQMSEEDFGNLYEGISKFQVGLENVADDQQRLANEFSIYEQQIQNIPDDAKEGFNSIYSLYASYANMIARLGLQGKEKTDFLIKMQTLGISENEYQDLLSTYIEATGKTEDDFEKWLGSAVANNSDKKDIIAALTASTSNQELRNAIRSATLLSNQQAIENYTKRISTANSLRELSEKAAAGTMTAEDWRTLEAEHPEILENEEKYKQFIAGLYDASDIRAEASAEYREELEAQLNEAIIDGDKSQIKMLEEQLELLQYAALFELEIWEEAAKVTREMQRQKQLSSELNKLQKEYESLVSSSQRKNNLSKQIALLTEQYKNNRELLNNENYLRGVREGWIVDGELIATQEDLMKLGEEKAWDWLNENKDAMKEAYDLQEEALEGLRDVLTTWYENEKEILEDRKESYEDYFDRVDALEEQHERDQSRQDVIRQLSALSGGVGGNTASARKELLEQLNDLNAEEAEARKQALRDSVINDIDGHVENIDNNIKALVGKGFSELTILANGLGIDGGEVTQNKNGGLIDYTGLAWVDGTKARPEAFLDATDTSLLRSVLDILLDNFEAPSLLNDDADEVYNMEQSITIGNITIQTTNLNNSQDFKSAGTILAQEFAKIIQERGLNVNVKK